MTDTRSPSQKKRRGDESMANGKRDRLIRDAKDFILQVLSKSEGTVYAKTMLETGGLNPWSSLSKDWQNERDVLFVALKHEHVKVRDLPQTFWGAGHNQEFLFRSIETNGNVWMGLPEELAADVRFARSIKQFDKRLAKEVMRKLPPFRQDRDFWEKVMLSGFGESLFGFLEEEAPPSILLDETLMVQAVLQGAGSHDHKNLGRVNPALLKKERFVELLLETDPSFLPHLPQDAQVLFPQVIAKSFQSYSDLYGKDELVDLAGKLAPDLFQNRGIMHGWCSAGAPYLPNRQPRRWMNDETVLLSIAKHCSKRDAMESFRYASSKMRGNKEFMCKVVEANPWLYLLAAYDLMYDFDLAVLAFGSSKEFTEDHARDKRFKGFIESLQRKIRLRLQTKDSSVLSIIRDGACTSTFFEKPCITNMYVPDCLDPPNARKLRLLREALKNLDATLGPAPVDDTFNSEEDADISWENLELRKPNSADGDNERLLVSSDDSS